MERGPRYEAYSRLRDSKLRKKLRIQDDYPESEIVEIEMPKPDLSPSPLKKSVKFQDPGGFPGQKRKSLRPPSSSMVAQSVPDFSSALKKENRRPPPANRMMDKAATPPPPMSKASKIYGSGSKLGSRSVNSGERKTGVAARKSYACIEELKGLSAAASLSIAGENRGGRGGSQRVVGRTSVLGIRKSVQFY
ncbi:hypothetical protein V2J09_012648 [Rumex salicifolius]